MIKVSENINLDFTLAVIHTIYNSDRILNADTDTSFVDPLIKVLTQPHLSEQINSIKELLEETDLDAYELMKISLLGKNYTYFSNSSKNTIDGQQLNLLLNFLNTAKQTSKFDIHWKKILLDKYRQFVPTFQAWVKNYSPAELFSSWLGEQFNIKIEIAPTFFMPAPPTGRAGFLTNSRNGKHANLQLIFGLPKYGSWNMFGMDRGWLRRGIGYYFSKEAMARYKSRGGTINQALVKRFSEEYYIDEHKAIRHCENYLTRNLEILILEDPENRISALNHMRGGGYPLSPWMLHSLDKAHIEKDSTRELFKRSLDIFEKCLPGIAIHGHHFAGPLGACDMDMWAKDAVMNVTPQCLSGENANRRFRAIARSRNFRMVRTTQEDYNFSDNSIWLIGFHNDLIVKRILEWENIEMTDNYVRAFGHCVYGSSLLFSFLRKHPHNPQKWFAVTVASSKEALSKLGRVRWDQNADYCIVTPEKVLVHGLFGSDYWNIPTVKIGNWGEWPANHSSVFQKNDIGNTN